MSLRDFVRPIGTVLGAPSTCVHTIYFDWSAGSNANTFAQAQNKSTPWAAHRWMNDLASGNAATYSHTPGDCFIFKGGVTWPMETGSSTTFFRPQAGGITTAWDYYGVDPTWFNAITGTVNATASGSTLCCGTLSNLVTLVSGGVNNFEQFRPGNTITINAVPYVINTVQQPPGMALSATYTLTLTTNPERSGVTFSYNYFTRPRFDLILRTWPAKMGCI